MSSLHMYAWKAGLKTGMYYLRTRPAVDAIKFTLDVEELLKNVGNINASQMNINVNKQIEDKKVIFII